MTVITAYPADQRAAAEEYAAQIGGYVTEGYNEYGALAVRHDAADGLTVTRWSSIDIEGGATLQRRDSLQPGDTVVSSHNGRREVEHVEMMGTGPGTAYLRLVGVRYPEAYPADSLIPVVSKATA